MKSYANHHVKIMYVVEDKLTEFSNNRNVITISNLEVLQEKYFFSVNNCVRCRQTNHA